MKTLVYAALALAIILVPAAALAVNAPSCAACSPGCDKTCPTPAYDRTPVCTITPTVANPTAVSCVDPWSDCGAFCKAGQLSPGWPFGWHADYWLRPDSNF